MKKIYLLLIITGVIAFVSIAYGFSSTTSPFKARSLQLDIKREADIATIIAEIQSKYYTDGELPNSLQEVPNIEPMNLIDPETKKPYEYMVTSISSYNICATFSHTSKEIDTFNGYSRVTGMTQEHTKGYVCLPQTVVDDSQQQAVCSGYYCGQCNESQCGVGKQSGGGCEWDGISAYCTESSANAQDGEACYVDSQCQSGKCLNSVCSGNKSTTTNPTPTIIAVPSSAASM